MAELTAQEQLMLELINAARMDPAGTAAQYGIDLNQGLAAGTITAASKQVLAPNALLTDAAVAHSSWMLSTDTFSHTGVNGSSPYNRMISAGFHFTGNWTWGENIAWSGSTGAFNADAAVAQQAKNLFLSAGHRENILDGDYREIGIGSVAGVFTSGGVNYNALMTTEDFAKSGTSIFVTGVEYNDNDKDNFYSIGEGIGGRTITILQDGIAVSSTTSQQAGGYALATALSGLVEVCFSGGNLPAVMGADVSLAASNVKLDLVNGDTILCNVTATLTQSSLNLTLLGIDNVDGVGNSLDNVIQGNKGNNALTGGGGDDTLTGGAGVDTFDGGSGDDIVVADGSDNLQQSFGGDGYDKIYITGTLPSGFDFAANGFEELWVNGVLAASSGTSSGGGGGTTPPAPQTLTGTSGVDTLIGADGNDTISGLDGNDVLTGNGGGDTLDGGAGADSMAGGAGNDTYVVDNVGDLVDESGGSGVDLVLSSTTFSLADVSKVKGNVENLTLTGTAAINGTGNNLDNIIIGNDANNKLSGGAGIDTVSYETASTSVSVSLATTKTQATGAGSDRLSGFENLTGSGYGDHLTGSAGNNVIDGLAGNDKILGGGGNDSLHGGAGTDTLTGGAGADSFVFSSVSDGADVVTDFLSGTDKIDLSELLGAAGLDGTSYATLVADGNLTFQTGDFATETTTNSSKILDIQIYFDADGSGSASAVLIATLEDAKVVSGDFLV